MRVNFTSSKDTGETRTIYVWIDNKNVMWGSATENIIRDLFQLFSDNYQKQLKKVQGSDFCF